MATGNLSKMTTRYSSPVEYELPVGEARIAMNELLGKSLHLRFEGEIHCVNCGKRTKSSFSQGHCFPCMRKLAACDLCVLRPETCHYHQGTCRDPAWAVSHCFIPHLVYLANSSGIKVGLTREGQHFTRWMDQGASQALAIARLRDRHAAGRLEVHLKTHVPDKTNWRTLLKGPGEDLDLAVFRERVMVDWPADLNAEILDPREVHRFQYPVEKYPEKLKAHNLDKEPVFEGKLLGIKGQYLILDSGLLNVRKYTGYLVSVET